MVVWLISIGAGALTAQAIGRFLRWFCHLDNEEVKQSFHGFRSVVYDTILGFSGFYVLIGVHDALSKTPIINFPNTYARLLTALMVGFVPSLARWRRSLRAQ